MYVYMFAFFIKKKYRKAKSEINENENGYLWK